MIEKRKCHLKEKSPFGNWHILLFKTGFKFENGPDMGCDGRGEGYGITHVHVSGQKLKVILLMVGPVQLGVHRIVVTPVEVGYSGGSGLSGHMYAHGHGERIP